jgi:TadE-like protein
VKDRIIHNLHRLGIWAKPHGERGQSMVEMALAFPILLLIMAGTLEVGKYMNDYLTVLDATREAARYAADGDIALALEPSLNCDDNFYHQAACLAKQNLYGISFNELTDDIVVSALSVDSTGNVLARFPQSCPPHAPSYLPNYCDGLVATDEHGWSYCAHIAGGGCQPAASLYNTDAVEAMLANSPGGPPTGLVIVEIYRKHKQFLGLIPPGLNFMPQEVTMHAYTMMPLPSAAPPPSQTP